VVVIELAGPGDAAAAAGEAAAPVVGPDVAVQRRTRDHEFDPTFER
jgi:hypothetical protein